MKEVIHDLLRDRAIRFEEGLSEIEVSDAISARKSRDTFVHQVDVCPCLVRRGAAWKDPEQQDAGRRRTAMQLGADGGNAGGDLIRCVELDVVRANHHHDDLRADIVELAVRQPPEHVLSAVPSVAEVDDATAREEPVPLVHAGSPAADGVAAPEMRDRVAKHHDFRLAALHQRGRGRVTVGPVVNLKITVLRDRHERGRRSRAKCRRRLPDDYFAQRNTL